MILALQTAGNVSSLYLLDSHGKSLAADQWVSGRALADELLGRLETFLKANDCGFDSLTGLVIFSGPGSFTSLRIGHTVLNALAGSLGIPVVGAQGENWLDAGIGELADAPLGRPALPHYGAEANVTPPKS